MTVTKACKTCGAPFTASRAGATVNCPAHRGRRTATPAATQAGPPVCRCGKTVMTPGVTCPRAC